MAKKTNDPLGKDLMILQHARAHWAKGNIGFALKMFERAVEHHPRSLRALLDAARAFGSRHELAKAEQYLKRAQRLAGRNVQAVATLAQTYRMIQREEKAIALFESLQGPGKGGGTNVLFELAVLYERTDHTARAYELIRECVEQDPAYLEPKLVQARLERRRGDREAAVTILRSLAEAKAAHPLLRAQAHGELAQVADEEGDFEGAIEAIEQCKAIVRAQPLAEKLSKQAVVNNEILRRLYVQLDRETLQRWSEVELPPDERVRGVGHLLGFPRSGTTLIEQVLDAHPSLVSSQERVVFSRDIFMSMYKPTGQEGLSLDSLRAIAPERLASHRVRYLDYMEAALGEDLGGRFHLDKNPNHTSLMAGLFRLFPESKFLVALRDPRDVIVSCYLRYLPLTEFSAAFLTWGSTCMIHGFEMSVWLHMRRIMEGNWHEVRYEETVSDLEAQARRAIGFLGLDWDPGMMDYRKRLEGRRVNSPSHEEVRKPVHHRAVGRWENYARWLGPYLERLGPLMKELGYGS